LHSDFQTYRFVMSLSLFAAFLLALTATNLKDKQDYNIEVDRKKNVLKCAGVDVSKLESDEVIKTYKNIISEKVLSEEGDLINIPHTELKNSEDKSTGQIYYLNSEKKYLPLFEHQANGKLNAYILPISGKGLWSTLYGYIALDQDLNTVKGITFYKHGETPGLGGEVEKEWFQNNFINKTIFDEKDNLVSIIVAKGIASGKNLNHKVDGMSGATMTGTGLTTFLKADLKRYLPFINKQKVSEKLNGEIGA
jgi:Na+-transporting NADH:ubiquinone oxidoreductase subunit C